MSSFSRKLKSFTKFCLFSVTFGLFSIIAVIYYYSRSLPSYEKLTEYDPPVTSRLYAADGSLVAEFAKEKRSFTPIELIPKHLILAFLAAEDSNFYQHAGVDPTSILRAIAQNFQRVQEGKNLIGASTITQQVVKNILLTKERTIDRKIKEAILAIRITNVLSKDRVLELYLNEIFLGYRSYGVTSAALNYFNKSLDELSIAEAALLAAMPKAPTSLDPRKNYNRALGRRNWVISRMHQDGFISKEDKELAIATPIILNEAADSNIISAGSFSEEARKILTEKYSEETLAEEGLVVTTSLRPDLQNAAFRALRKGIKAYDKRHGYRGPYQQISLPAITIAENLAQKSSWLKSFTKIQQPLEMQYDPWKFAVILEVNEAEAAIYLKNGEQATLQLEELSWTKIPSVKLNEETGEETPYLKELETLTDIFAVGDIIIVNKIAQEQYSLEQIPEINGSALVMNPHDGTVLAMVGGYNDNNTEFNRATQAIRQPGSIIKPFTYLAALENMYAPTTIIIDDEVRMKKEDGTYWIPMNYSEKFYGPTPMRIGLEKSRNVATVRLAEMVGLGKIANVVKRYGVDDKALSNYAMILGSAETTLENITTAYAMIANGGKKIEPTLIEKLQDKNGKILFRRDNSSCTNCQIASNKTSAIALPELSKNQEQITDERSAYQMISLLEGVVERGTAWRARSLKKPIAGKTGTTNDSFDTWFVGFSPDYVVGVWVGFDQPKSLGKHETGSSVTVPIFIDIMRATQENTAPRPFKVPEGLKFAKIDRNTGKSPSPTTLKKDIIFEVFKAENYAKIFAAQDEADEFEPNYENVIY